MNLVGFHQNVYYKQNQPIQKPAELKAAETDKKMNQGIGLGLLILAFMLEAMTITNGIGHGFTSTTLLLGTASLMSFAGMGICFAKGYDQQERIQEFISKQLNKSE